MKLFPAPELPHSAQIPEKEHFHLTTHMSQRECTNSRKSRLGRKAACGILWTHWSTREFQHFCTPCRTHPSESLWCLNAAVTSHWSQQLNYTHKGEFGRCAVISSMTFIFQLQQNSRAQITSNSWGRYHRPISDPQNGTSVVLLLLFRWRNWKQPDQRETLCGDQRFCRTTRGL